MALAGLCGQWRSAIPKDSYPNADIEAYLPGQKYSQEIQPEELEAELALMWQQGNRRTLDPTDTFPNHATTAAVYRVLAKKKCRKGFSGFEQYALLSSGVVSNYIELCKYAFFFALSDQLPLKVIPAIPTYLQTNAAYSVSERLFDTIDGNVPEVGGVLKQLISDLAVFFAIGYPHLANLARYVDRARFHPF